MIEFLHPVVDVLGWLSLGVFLAFVVLCLAAAVRVAVPALRHARELERHMRSMEGIGLSGEHFRREVYECVDCDHRYPVSVLEPLPASDFIAGVCNCGGTLIREGALNPIGGAL